MGGMFKSPSIPKPPPPAPVEDPAISDEEQRRLAMQRKTLDDRRASRQSFVVNPGAPTSGLRIPQG